MRWFLALVGAAVLFGSAADACSTLSLRGGGAPVLARNTDSPIAIPGFFVVNRRGVAKTAMAWGVFGPGPRRKPWAHWVSRYGSVTVTSIGREFPDGGMNEAGLAVEEMTLDESRYPPASGRPAIAQVQWIQYQLDNFSNVGEVLAHLDDLRIVGWPWHFTVADASGACATIEFVNGKAVVGRGQGHGCALTNDTLARSRTALGKPEPGDGSLARFSRASDRVSRYRPDDAGQRVAYAFAALADVAQKSQTFRSTVHDLRDRRIYFRSPSQPGEKLIDLKRLDFSRRAPVKTIAYDTPGAGDVTSKMTPYSRGEDARVVHAFYGLVAADAGARAAFKADLDARGETADAFLSALSRYPDHPAG